jgi:pimeloyl-ACP methyl ester carboxylesterase
MTDISPDVPSLLPLAQRHRLALGRRIRTPVGTAEHARNVVWHTWSPEQPATGQAPVVLFHGGSGSWTHWVKNIVPLLDAGRRVLAVDLPGFGDSDPPVGGTDADAMLAPLADSLGQLLGGEPADLVGFSFGGMTAGMLLAEHPALARRLVLVGAPAMGVVPGRQFELKAWRHLKSAQDQVDIHRHNLGVLMLHDHDLIDGLALEVHIDNVQRDRLPRRRLAHTDILARSLPRVPCPVHAIYGAHDVLYRSYLAQLEAAFARSAPDFRGLRLIDGAGHWVQFEAPEAFDAALADVLQLGQ